MEERGRSMSEFNLGEKIGVHNCAYKHEMLMLEDVKEFIRLEQLLWNDCIDGKITRAEFWIKRNELLGEKLK
jgi:hypothetical protein